MGRLLAAVAEEGNLLDAWVVVKEKAEEDGDAGPAVRRFERTVTTRLSALHAQLAGGTWRPHPLQPVRLAADPDREIRIAVVEDRVVERAVLQVVEPVLDPLLLPWCFAYRRGLGVADALRALQEAYDDGCRWAVRADVADCFDSIPRWPLVEVLARCLPDSELRMLLVGLMNRPVRRSGGPRRPDRGRGLHQGTSLAPLLANLYLDQFDRAMLQRGYKVLRYADDFAIPVRERHHAADALEAARAELDRLELTLHAAKTAVQSYQQGVAFLGQTVSSGSTPVAARQSHPLEGTVFLTEQGSICRTRGERMRVEKGGVTLLSVNFRRVRQVVAVGRVGFTTAFLQRALDDDIEVALLSADGRWRGRLAGAPSGAVDLRRAQYRTAERTKDALALARAFVCGKIANCRVALLRAARRAELPGLLPLVERLSTARGQAELARHNAALMGHEGAATRDYFAGLSMVIGDPWTFTTRQRRPAPDPVNSMISFASTLLTFDGVTALRLAGLDPEVGFLHAPRWGRPALALDLVEEFRALVAEAVVLRVIGTRQLTPADFEYDDERGCRLSDHGRRVFLAAYERRMLTLVSHPLSAARVSYRRAMHLQARVLAQVVLGDRAVYEPIGWR